MIDNRNGSDSSRIAGVVSDSKQVCLPEVLRRVCCFERRMMMRKWKVVVMMGVDLECMSETESAHIVDVKVHVRVEDQARYLWGRWWCLFVCLFVKIWILGYG